MFAYKLKLIHYHIFHINVHFVSYYFFKFCIYSCLIDLFVYRNLLHYFYVLDCLSLPIKEHVYINVCIIYTIYLIHSNYIILDSSNHNGKNTLLSKEEDNNSSLKYQ